MQSDSGLYTGCQAKNWMRRKPEVSYVPRKCALKSLSLPYQKKNWQARLHQSFFWYYTDYNCAPFLVICECSKEQYIYSRCHTQRRIGGLPKEGLAWAPPTNPPLGRTTTKILRHIFSWHGSSDSHPDFFLAIIFSTSSCLETYVLPMKY